jgi:hypothetical protein
LAAAGFVFLRPAEHVVLQTSSRRVHPLKDGRNEPQACLPSLYLTQTEALSFQVSPLFLAVVKKRLQIGIRLHLNQEAQALTGP